MNAKPGTRTSCAFAKVGVTIRVEAAPAALRGRPVCCSRTAERRVRPGRWVPDQEIRFQVSPRNVIWDARMKGIRHEGGAALLIRDDGAVLVSALGAALLLMSSVGTPSSPSIVVNSREALYAADAIVEHEMADVLAVRTGQSARRNRPLRVRRRCPEAGRARCPTARRLNLSQV